MDEQRFSIVDAADVIVGEIVIFTDGDKSRISRTDFINSFSTEISAQRAADLAKAAQRRDWALLNSFDPEFLPWYCPKCGVIYASDQWKVWAKFDEGEHWLDSYRGACPQGHERMIAD